MQQLILHNIKVAQAVHSGISGGEPVNPFDVGGDLPPEGAEAAFRASTNTVLEDLKAPGNLDKLVDSPFGKVAVSEFIMLPFGDMVIHKWDLAKAVGQDVSIDSSLAEICYHRFADIAEGGRNAGAFGAEIEVPMCASMMGRLLGVTGRMP